MIRPEAKSIFPYSNSVFIDDEIPTMIDAGAGGRAYAQISLNKVQQLLLSHYHFDHVNGWPFFKQSKIFAGIEERWAYEDEKKYLSSTGFQHWETLMGEKKIENWADRRELPADVPSKPGFQHFQPNEYFQDRTCYQTGKTSFIAIHTPGHSPGHYAFFFPAEKILFSGDLDISPGGPWYGDECADFGEIVQSVNTLSALKPDVLVTSHRRVFHQDIEKLFSGYLEIGLNREKNIQSYLVVPRSLDDIASQDFARYRQNQSTRDQFWTKMMILKHLKRLQSKHMIVQHPNGYYELCQEDCL